MVRVPNFPMRRMALRGTARLVGESEFMEIRIDIHDLNAIEEFGNTLAEGIPGNYMRRLALAVEVVVEEEMQNVATLVSDTGAMANSVTTEIDMRGVQSIVITGHYDVPYEEFVDTGTWPSLGRFVPALIPRDTTHWNMRGARLSTRSGSLAGRVWGFHPGTPARHIWDQVDERVTDRMEVFETELMDEFRIWLDGVMPR